jgi:hypothetical protein
VGLIQRIIESGGISTISISVNRPYTERVKPPRSIFLHWPFGHPLGEPGRIDQQTAVLTKAFEALYTIETPGEIIDVGWPWRRQTYPEQPWRHSITSPGQGKNIINEKRHSSIIRNAAKIAERTFT